jgi:hypothetical protein
MTVPLIDVICQRFIKFTIYCINSSNALVSFVTHKALSELHMNSSVARNMFLCSDLFLRSSRDLDCKLKTSLMKRIFTTRVLAQQIVLAEVGLELIFARDGVFKLDNFSYSDINLMLNWCTFSIS